MQRNASAEIAPLTRTFKAGPPARARPERSRMSHPARTACALGVVGALSVSLSLLLLAVWLYPGGSARDPHSPGFDLWRNYLCDLLHRTSLSGQPNPAAGLARASLLLFAAGLVPFFHLLASLLPPAGSRLGGGALRWSGTLSALGWMALAFTPSDRFPLGHSLFVLAGIVPAVVAGALAVHGLWARRRTRGLALLAGCALLFAAADAGTYLLLLLSGRPSLAVIVPTLQRLAGLFLIACMLGVALTVLRRPWRQRSRARG